MKPFPGIMLASAIMADGFLDAGSFFASVKSVVKNAKVIFPFLHPCSLMIYGAARLAAAEPEASARTGIGTTGEIWTGQKVSLVVELLAPGYFAGAPAFDLPKLPGSLIVPPVGSPVVFSEDHDGQSYTVQRHELMVFPRRPGKIGIPSFEIRFPIKRNALDHDTVACIVKTTPVSFGAASPPGAAALALTSTDLQVSETWNPEPGKQAKPGDAFVRTITWSASDVTGIAFPPFPKEDIPGLGIYRKDPLVADTSDRGQLHGSRVDTITYVCKTGGAFTIPRYLIRWWDPVGKELETTGFPARTFTVVVPPPPPEPLSHKAWRYLRGHAREISSIAAACVVILVTFRLWRPRVVRFYQLLHPRHLPPLNPPHPS